MALGRWLQARISQGAFYRLVNLMLAAVGLRYLWDGVRLIVAG
jgi:uncharacterized membrane protein YfcA